MHFPFHRFGRETEGRRFMHGFGRHHGHHGRHRHGGRGGRFFEQGDLRLVILHLIAEKPRHGYEIIKAIEERMAGAYSPSPGVIYPTLTLLEELGQIAAAETEGSRKLYAITPEGERVLAENRPAVEAILGRMTTAAGERPAGSALQVMRAMHNLKLALRLRLARSSLSEEQLHRIVAAIDAAAVQVERE